MASIHRMPVVQKPLFYPHRVDSFASDTDTDIDDNSNQPEFPLHNVNIYPPIGIARVGNSRLESLDDGWFYGPENPGHFDEPKGGFKDEHGAVKRQVKFFFPPPVTLHDLISKSYFGQAARFRVYGTNSDGDVIEANKASGYELVWKVQVANKKASWYTFMGGSQFHQLKLASKANNVLREKPGRRFRNWLYDPSQPKGSSWCKLFNIYWGSLNIWLYSNSLSCRNFLMSEPTLSLTVASKM